MASSSTKNHSSPGQLYLENQCLVVQIVPTRILVLKGSEVQVSALSDEVIIAQTEDVVLVVPVLLVVLPINRNDADALPLLVQQAGVLGAAVVQAEATQLAVHVEVEEGAVGGGVDSGLQDAAERCDAAGGAVVCGCADVCRVLSVEDVDVPVDGQRAALPMTRARVAREDEESAVPDVEDLALRRRLRVLGWAGGGVIPLRELDDEFSSVARRLARVADVVFQETGIAVGLFAEAALLVNGGLQQDIEVALIARDGQAFEALIVLAAGRIIRRDDIIAGTIVDVMRGRVSREGLAAIAHGNDGVGGPDSGEHLAGGREVIHIRGILIRDPEAAVIVEDQAFVIEGNPLAEDGLVATTEAISGICGDGEIREAGVREVAAAISVETGAGCAIGAVEEHRVFVSED
jgi:hypothetical protein